MTFFYLVKDYIEVVHKLIETSPSHVLQHSTYTDSLTILSFGLSSFKQLCINFLSFEWLKQLWYFPIIVPEIATSMMEEISVLDGNFHNLLTFLDKPIAVGNEVYGNYYLPLTCFEKIFTGLINSLFIWLPTSTATFICFRRFIMQGVEAGYSAALGTMAASLFWLTSIIFGLRFIIVPWMSLDLFRYWLGFLLLMKYFWDNRYAYKEVKHNSVFGKQTRRNIFAFHFLLALTEQTSLYPFLSNLSISSQSTLLEGFPAENMFDFTLIHFSYLLGIAIGSYSLINLLSWFWQDPAYRFYFWIMNKFKKLRVADIVRPVHLFFQSITVLFAFSSLPYFGIEYQVTNPLGFVPNDQVFHQFKQTSFLTHSTSPPYYRSRLNFPRQKFFRYEDWAEYYHRNTPLDTSLYDQGAYRLYTMEDLSYGKDYEWMRRRSDKIKIRSRLKRLRWFPRNWANRLWEFTKTWSRRNVLWRNDILNMYQYSWDSKAPIIWNKLVFEEFFPTSFGKSTNNISNNSALNSGKSELLTNQQSNKGDFLTTNKSISKNWDSFWGPDPDWTTKFLSNQPDLTNTDPKFRLNYLSRFNVSDNDVWWKWLSNPEEAKNTGLSKKTQKQDFWQPQNRVLSIYSENTNVKKQELNLEFSTLRKFVRKLTARFKLATINEGVHTSEPKAIFSRLSFDKRPYRTNNFSSNSLKTLLITPSLKDWTVFQTLLANINSVLWWQRFSPGVTLANKSKKFVPLNTNSNDLKKQEPVLFDQKHFKKLGSLQGFISSEDQTKFERIQDKYREVQNRRNSLVSEMNSSKTNTSLKSLKQDKLPTSLKLLKSKFLSIDSGNIKPTSNSNNLKTNNFLVFLNHKKPNDFRLKSAPLSSSEIGTISDKNSSSTLLHPVKYYLHNEQNFKRKLRFYGVKNTRSFALNNISYTPTNGENNLHSNLVFDKGEPSKSVRSTDLVLLKNKNKLPIFNFYLKTYFQTYKKTKLYVLNTKMKRQLGMGASARRKGRDYSNKLLKRAKILSNTPWIRQWIDQSGFLARRKRLETWIARQHYDPNELWAKIMKTDVDLFMKRQPSSYFLTNTEENLLHLRRFLLFEYYDSLRWYTYMTNYRSMKNSIGGTKSFTNKLYNQQFKGTFHKVRHLFSLTPSASNGSLLKFDRPLYNFDESNKVSSVLRNNSHGPWYHEELTDFEQQNSEKSEYTKENGKWDSLSTGSKMVKVLRRSDLELNSKAKAKLPSSFAFENTSQNEIIKNNLQKRLMMKILNIRKKQKWTVDYKRASEKLWKKWKLRSNIQESKPLVIFQSNSLIPGLAETKTVNLTESPSSNISNIFETVGQDDNVRSLYPVNSSLTRKLVQIKKLELFEEKNKAKISINNSSLINSGILNSSDNQFNKPFNFQKIFNQNIFTRKLINERYKKVIAKTESSAKFKREGLKISLENFKLSKGGNSSFFFPTSSRLFDSFNFNLRNIIENRILKKTSTIEFQDKKSRVNTSQFSKLSADLDNKTNIQLYEINKIRQERSNIQNFVFMKKFLVNESFTTLTRSQLRPLPGKRTKALYDKLASSKSNVLKSSSKESYSVFNLSSVQKTRLSKLETFGYKEGTLPPNATLIAEKSFASTEGNSPFLQNSKDLVLLSRLNSKWKVLVNTLRNSPELVSNTLDKKLQIKLIKDQKEKLLTTALKGPIFQKTEVQKDFFTITNSSLRESSGFKNIAIQKLTKTLLSKNKNGNSALLASLKDVEKPITSRITKSARKRQQDFVSRSLLKRHLNLKSRRKLFLKTKEINNQRMVLDRKYEIQERVFLNQIGFLSEVKKGLELPLSSDMTKAKETNLEKKSDNSSIRLKNFLAEETLSQSATTNLKLKRWLTFSKTALKNNSVIFSDQNKTEIGSSGLSSSALKNKKEINTLLPQDSISNVPNQSYLSSTKRSTLFIDKILKQHKLDREISQNYLNYKLKQNFSTSSSSGSKFGEFGGKAKTLENEKSSLRRTLRKFSTGTSLPSLNEKVKSLTTSSKATSYNSSFPETSFINNLLLKTWLTKLGKSEAPSEKVGWLANPTINLVTIPRGISDTKERVALLYSGSIAEKMTPKSSFALSTLGLAKGGGSIEPELINLNKYIMFARTNQNKLSRQQIRKKLKKRRIIRMKRTERLKTLKDHPLKFRSEQIQTFYNIRDSLKKWKDSSFILEKNKYTNSFFSKPKKFLDFVEANNNKDFQKLQGRERKDVVSSFKPLNLLQRENTSETGNILASLYKDIFINSSKRVDDWSYGGDEMNNQTLIVTDTKPLLVNTINMPFYAGWDESLRKFVLTNRLLNRREAGYQSSNIIAQNNNSKSSLNTRNSAFVQNGNAQVSRLATLSEPGSSVNFFSTKKNNPFEENNIIFSLWPLKGKNPATTLFSQFPFMTAPQTNLTYSPQQIRSIKSGSKYDVQNSINFNKLSNRWEKRSARPMEEEKDNKSDKFTSNNTTSYLNFKKMNRIKTFIKSSKNEDQIGIRQSGQVISNLSNPTTRKLARQALFSGRSGSTNGKKLSISKRTASALNQNSKFFISGTLNKSSLSERHSDAIDKKLSTKSLLLRNLRQGNRAQTQLIYLRRLQKTLRPTGSSWKTNQVLSRRKKQRIKQNNFWDQKKSDGSFVLTQNDASTRFSVRKRKKRGNNKNPRLRGDKNYKKTKRQYRQKLYLRPKNKPLRRRSLGVTFKNKLNYWRRNYQYLSLKDANRTKDLKAKTDSRTMGMSQKYLGIPSDQTSSRNIGFQSVSENIEDTNTSVGINSLIFSENLKANNYRYSQRDKEWKVFNKLEKTKDGVLSLSQQSSVTRRPRQLYRSLFRNPNVHTPILYTTLPGHSRSIPLIKNLPLPSSSVKTLNRVIKWSSADGASRFYRVNLSYGWAMTLFLNNLRQKVNSENSSSVNSLIKAYLNELEKNNQTKFSSSREFKRRFYKLRQLSYTMSLRLYDRWFFYYYKTTNSQPQQKEPLDENLFFNQKIETNLNNKLKQSILSSSAVDPVEQTLSPFKHMKKFLTFQLVSTESKRDKKKNAHLRGSGALPYEVFLDDSSSSSRKEKAVENQSNFRSYLKNLRNTAISFRRSQNETKTQNQVIDNTQTLENPNTFNENNQSNGIVPSSVKGQASTLVSELDNKKSKELSGLDNFKLFSSENTETQQNSTFSNFNQSNFFSSDKKDNQESVKSNKTLLKKEKKYAEDRFFFAQFNKPPLVDDYRLTLENNRHYPLNGGFVWPGDYLRLQTILLPKEMKDLYLFKKANAGENGLEKSYFENRRKAS